MGPSSGLLRKFHVGGWLLHLSSYMVKLPRNNFRTMYMYGHNSKVPFLPAFVTIPEEAEEASYHSSSSLDVIVLRNFPHQMLRRTKPPALLEDVKGTPSFQKASILTMTMVIKIDKHNNNNINNNER